jgi:hypothetical protein
MQIKKRAALNKENRKRGTSGNGDGKDVSHKKTGKTLTIHVFIAEKLMTLVSYLSIMFILGLVAGRMSQQMSYAPAPVVIRRKEVPPSLNG